MNDKGPVTAMTFLHNATKDWSNITPINYIYNDKATHGTTAENTSYTSFVSTNGVATITPLTGEGVTIGSEATPLRARMPIYSSDTTKTEVTSKINASYLYDNLYRTGMDGPNGYWTLSSNANDFYLAWYVYCEGNVTTSYGGWIWGNFTSIGVRPVITLKI